MGYIPRVHVHNTRGKRVSNSSMLYVEGGHAFGGMLIPSIASYSLHTIMHLEMVVRLLALHSRF